MLRGRGTLTPRDIADGRESLGFTNTKHVKEHGVPGDAAVAKVAKRLTHGMSTGQIMFRGLKTLNVEVLFDATAGGPSLKLSVG